MKSCTITFVIVMRQRIDVGRRAAVRASGAADDRDARRMAEVVRTRYGTVSVNVAGALVPHAPTAWTAMV